jgi:alcohol dehydrogenase (NADP+)
LEKVYRSGKARAIGVSNFNKAEIENILKNADVPPAAHQFELHPYLQQSEFVKWHHEKGIHVTAYSPFGNSNPAYEKGSSVPQLIQDPVLVDIGKKYNKSGAQVALAWGIGNGVSVIPKSKTESRIKQNFEGDFKLSDEDLKSINKLDKKLRLSDPSKMFGWEFFVGLDGK